MRTNLTFPHNPLALVASALLLALCAPLAAADAPAWVDDFAEQIYKAWHAGAPMPQLSAAHPEATLADGYAVQQRFMTRVLEDDTIGGFKAAVVGQGGQDNLGVDGPIVGVVPGSGVLAAKDNVTIDLADYPNRAVETEIGYIFDTAVDAPPADVEALRRHVKAVALVIEVPGGLTEDKHPATAADLAAWNGNARTIIVGPEHAPSEHDLDAIEIKLTHDGETINTAQGGQAAGGQWATLLKAVNGIVGQGYTIQPGHVFTNGALGDIVKAEVGEYRADYGLLGGVVFSVVDSAAE